MNPRFKLGDIIWCERRNTFQKQTIMWPAKITKIAQLKQNNYDYQVLFFQQHNKKPQKLSVVKQGAMRHLQSFIFNQKNASIDLHQAYIAAKKQLQVGTKQQTKQMEQKIQLSPIEMFSDILFKIIRQESLNTYQINVLKTFQIDKNDYIRYIQEAFCKKLNYICKKQKIKDQPLLNHMKTLLNQMLTIILQSIKHDF